MFDVRLQELTSALEEIADLLRDNNSEFWAGWVGQVLAGLKRYDAGALDQLLAGYRGGMGSFQDLVLGDWSGTASAGLRQANNRLSELRQRCHSLASYLRTELRRP